MPVSLSPSPAWRQALQSVNEAGLTTDVDILAARSLARPTDDVRRLADEIFGFQGSTEIALDPLSPTRIPAAAAPRADEPPRFPAARHDNRQRDRIMSLARAGRI